MQRLKEVDAANNPTEGLAVYHEVMGRRSATYMAHARHGEKRSFLPPIADDDEGYAGVALGCVQAIATNEQHFTGLNVPNNGTIAGMEDDDVVEVGCLIDGDGPHPIAVGTVPDSQ